MSQQLRYPVDRGCVTGIDPSFLEPGQIQEAEGVVYSPSDPAAHKHLGRSTLNSTAISADPIRGLKFSDFDSAVDRLLAHVNGTLYSADPEVGTFGSIRTGLNASAAQLDGTKFDDSYIMCNGSDVNWVVKSDNTTFQHGLAPQTSAPTFTSSGTGITGTFDYWCTEYDSINDVESATAVGAVLSVTITDDTVTITKPATVSNFGSHMRWRLYRSKDAGKFPIGWRLATIPLTTSTLAEAVSDAGLVTGVPYPIVTINGVSEGQNFKAPVFKSMATFEGSLIGVADRSLYWSESSLSHYFPVSYRLLFKPPFGGMARCVRRLGDRAIVFMDHDTFIVNYLPKQADSFFDAGVADKLIAHHGTPSPNGAAVFTGWGGESLCLVASRSTIMLTDGDAFEQAVRSIDWINTVPPASLDSCVLIDVPTELCIKMYYPLADGSWRSLHFYYDSSRIQNEAGRFPELAWTGPHIVPGPGTYGVTNNIGQVWTGSRASTGTVYKEGIGTTDAANLVDSNGTINFRLRTGRIYPVGVGGQATHERAFIHKASTGTGNYASTLTAHSEGDQSVPLNRSISASTQGATSESFIASAQSFDMRVVRDDSLGMPPINGITLTFDDLSEDWAKANRR